MKWAALWLVGCTSAGVAPPLVEHDAAVEALTVPETGPPDVEAAPFDASAPEAIDEPPATGLGACTFYAGSNACPGNRKLYLCPVGPELDAGDYCPPGSIDWASAGFVDGGAVVWCCA